MSNVLNARLCAHITSARPNQTLSVAIAIQLNSSVSLACEAEFFPQSSVSLSTYASLQSALM